MGNDVPKDDPSAPDGLIDDPLTGAASRRYLITKGERDISLASRHGEAVSVLQFEIDEFKNIYNQNGDEVADEMLVWVANTLKSQCRLEDVVARISGAVFAILSPRTNAAQALQACTRLRAAVMERAFVHNNIRYSVSFSIGIAVYGNEAEQDIEGLLKIAAQRAAEARQHGGNCVVAETGAVVALAASTEAAPGALGQPAAATTTVTIDEALAMLASRQHDRLKPRIAGLFQQLMPLLEYGNKELNLSLGFAIEAMKKRLKEVAIEREFGDD